MRFNCFFLALKCDFLSEVFYRLLWSRYRPWKWFSSIRGGFPSTGGFPLVGIKDPDIIIVLNAKPVAQLVEDRLEVRDLCQTGLFLAEAIEDGLRCAFLVHNGRAKRVQQVVAGQPLAGQARLKLALGGADVGRALADVPQHLGASLLHAQALLGPLGLAARHGDVVEVLGQQKCLARGDAQRVRVCLVEFDKSFELGPVDARDVDAEDNVVFLQTVTVVVVVQREPNNIVVRAKHGEPLGVDSDAHILLFREQRLLAGAAHGGLEEHRAVERPLPAVLQEEALQQRDVVLAAVVLVRRRDAALPLGGAELVVQQVGGDQRVQSVRQERRAVVLLGEVTEPNLHEQGGKMDGLVDGDSPQRP
eukprot:m.182742 g.182742  ORF g.182742 m.182742 type:complete len:362 (+) comp15382_c1_seq1:2332-3417(+)